MSHLTNNLCFIKTGPDLKTSNITIFVKIKAKLLLIIYPFTWAMAVVQGGAARLP